MTLLAPTSATAAVRNLSIQELNASESKFAGVEITVEGRVSLFGKNQLRFRNCDIPFRLAAGLPELARRSSNVEVTGHVVREEARLVFLVRAYREVSSDLDTFLQKRRLIRQSSPAEWYALADWAKERGTFYKDYELLARSDEARRQGVTIERRAVRGDAAGLLTLAGRVQAMDLPESLGKSIVHEAYHLRWKESREATPLTLEKLAKEMASALPGCTEPLRQPETELLKQYTLKPLDTYDAADEATQRKLHRVLYGNVVLRSITTKPAADAANGFEIADLIDRRVPEQHALAEEYRDKALASRAAEVAKLPRKEVLALRDQYVARDQPRLGEQVVESWLTLRRRKTKPDDTEGLMQLADEYRTLLLRNDTADRLLIEAWQHNPEANEVVEQLKRLGYRLKNGAWITLEEFNARPEEKLERAMREGRVIEGMTGAQVRRGLGEPLSLSRSASAGQITEVWTYGQIDASRLAIHLVKRRGQDELRVVTVAPIRQ